MKILLNIIENTIGKRRKIARHEMATILTTWSRQHPGALANTYVKGTWPDAAQDLPHNAGDDAWQSMWATVPNDYHVTAGRVWANMVRDTTIICAGEPGTLRDGGVRFDQPGSMAPGQMADVIFIGHNCAARAETVDYLREHCRRLIIVDEDSPLIVPPKHRDVDGTWVRYIYATELPATWTNVRDYLDEFGEEPDPWQESQTEKSPEVSPFRILQMIDPNSGQGSDAREKQRYQYVRIRGRVLSRMLPPEKFGDTWRNEPAPRPFATSEYEPFANGQGPSDYILTLLDL